jgi:hypothetical protein
VADALISAVIGTLEHCVRDDDRRLQTLELASATSQYAVVGSRALTCDKARRIEAAVTLIGFDLFGTQHWANFSPIWPCTAQSQIWKTSWLCQARPRNPLDLVTGARFPSKSVAALSRNTS